MNKIIERMCNLSKNNRNYLKLIVRASVSFGILLIIAYRIDWGLIKNNFLFLRKEDLSIAVFLLVAEMFLKSYKWNVLLKIINIKISFWDILKMYYMSNFLGMFMPSALGVDALRTYSISKSENNVSGAIFSVFFDRIFGIISLSMIMTYGVLSSSFLFYGDKIKILIIGIIIFIIFSIFAGFFDKILQIVNLLSEKFDFKLIKRINSQIDTGLQYITYIKKNRKRMIVFFIVTIAFQFNRILITYFVARSLNISIAIGYWIAIVPTITLLTMLPFSVAGLGVREGAFVFFLNKLDVPFSSAFLLSIFIFMLGIVLTFPGMIIYMKRGLAFRSKVAFNGE